MNINKIEKTNDKLSDMVYMFKKTLRKEQNIAKRYENNKDKKDNSSTMQVFIDNFNSDAKKELRNHLVVLLVILGVESVVRLLVRLLALVRVEAKAEAEDQIADITSKLMFDDDLVDSIDLVREAIDLVEVRGSIE